MKMTLAYIASAVGGRLTDTTDPERTVCGFYSDSRSPSEDKLFLALRGERVDGNSFVPALLQKAFAAISDNEKYVPEYGDCIVVDDVRDALQRLAAHYRKSELKHTTFIGITGSVGKTTTKDMIALAFSPFGKVHKTIGNSNSQIGVPQTVLDIKPDTDFAIVELGMSMPGEMERISRCVAPDVSVITNIGFSHIENLGSREAIRDEKLKIAMYSDEDASVIINIDETIWQTADFGSKHIVSVSMRGGKAEFTASDSSVGDQGTDFVITARGKKIPVRLSVRGEHFVLNSLLAIAAVSSLSLDPVAAASSLMNYESDGKRQFVYEKDGHRVISDCYNASPESMKASLGVLASYNGRKIAVLGDMLELGEYSESLHCSVGEAVSGKADVLVTYGEMARHIAKNARCSDIYSFAKSEREELLAFLKTLVREGDTVLYKASNGMNLSPLIV